MHRGLRLGLIWFGALGGVVVFFWIALGGRGVVEAALLGVVTFLVFAVYPFVYARRVAPWSDATPRSSRHWSDVEVAAMTFGGCNGVLLVIVGIVSKRLVPFGAAGLGAFALLGLLPAFLLRKRRLREPRPVDERDDLALLRADHDGVR